ncbi:MAG: AsmA-like C-terminal region-containing protein [Desulfuromonadaceae bacterium]|nr:AsmA-like C-terminal region-containing protein [Desulfuromonadaceae bacterium]
MLRRSAVFSTLVLVILTILCGGCLFLLNHYRNEIAAQVIQQIQQRSPTRIKLGEVQAGFHGGPTLTFRHIAVDSENLPLTLKARQLHVRLDFLDLLSGKITVARLILEQPDIVWTLDGTENDGTVASDSPSGESRLRQHLKTLHQRLTSWQRIELQDARLTVQSRNVPLWQLQHLAGSFHHQSSSAERKLTLHLAGEARPLSSPGSTPPAAAPLRFEFNGSLNPCDQSAEQMMADVELSCHQLDLATLPLDTLFSSVVKEHEFRPQLRGQCHVEARLHGALATGLQLEATLTPQGATLQQAASTADSRTALPIRRLSLQLPLTGTLDRLHWHDGRLKVGQTLLHSSGMLDVSDNRLTLDLSSSPIELKPVIPWAPRPLSPYLESATLQCQSLQYDGALDQFSASQIRDSHWDLRLNTANPLQQAVQIRLDQSGTSLRATTSALHIETGGLLFEGPLQARSEGFRTNGTSEIELDLSACRLDLAGVLNKTAGQPARLRCAVRHDTQGWQVREGVIEHPDLRLLWQASRSASGETILDLTLPSFELESISRNVELLTQMELRGETALRYHLHRDANGPWHGQGTLELKDCAIAPAHILAPIHHIRGTVTLDGWKASAPRLKVQLGSGSALDVEARIDDLRHPVADIHARGTGFIAGDLIFDSPDAQLNNLDGHIRIHGQGIDFVHAEVDLEQGTHAIVEGDLRFHGPELALDIHAPFGDIDEVIGLWQGTRHARSETATTRDNRPQAAVPAQPTAETGPPVLPADETLHLTCQVDQGRLHGFTFQQAQGVIHIQHGQLRIEPLTFKADQGTGQGRIIVHTGSHAQDQSAAGYLRINGEIQQIDADKVYRQILNQPSLASGQLDGTFHIQGPLGSGFLPHSSGLFRPRLQDGVLHRFHVLSKIFSLLNVTQLFRLKLPDMALAGMPFSQIKGEITLEEGVLQSQDLIISSDAMNMAVVGTYDLNQQEMDLLLGIRPLGTVDTVVTHLPVAGWLLTGEEKSVINTHVAVTGKADDPQVDILPVDTVSSKLFGILRRTITLPGTLISDPKRLLFNPEPQKP